MEGNHYWSLKTHSHGTIATAIHFSSRNEWFVLNSLQVFTRDSNNITNPYSACKKIACVAKWGCGKGASVVKGGIHGEGGACVVRGHVCRMDSH